MMPFGSSALESLTVPVVATGAVVVVRCCLETRPSFWANTIETGAKMADTAIMKTVAKRPHVLPIESPATAIATYTRFLLWRSYRAAAAKYEIPGAGVARNLHCCG